MATTNLNIRTDKDIKDQAEAIFNELGLNMTTAVNMFLRTAIREHGIPFELKLDAPNETTAAAIAEEKFSEWVAKSPLIEYNKSEPKAPCSGT